MNLGEYTNICRKVNEKYEVKLVRGYAGDKCRWSAVRGAEIRDESGVMFITPHKLFIYFIKDGV